MSETVVGERGMVVAPHRAAAEAGAEIMRAGGNAIEAMIAAAATIAVVYPHANSIGGDGFWLIAQPGKPPRVIEAAGAAGALAGRARYERQGYHEIPVRGRDAAITVAGAVSGWTMAFELATTLGGRLVCADLLANAIGHAKVGVPVSPSLTRSLAVHAVSVSGVPGFASLFMREGKPIAGGMPLIQARLADTLDHLASVGFDDFYRGDVGAEIAADLEAVGAPIVRADLEAHEARMVEPLELQLRDLTLFNTPPPTQGIASLILLGLFERLGVKRGESFEHIHGLIEASKRAYIVRDREVTDPRHAGDLSSYLTPAWLDSEAAKIDMRRAAPAVAGAAGDTVWLGAIDKDGLAVSYIQSLFRSFGSGVVLPRTGIVWHNRGIAFSLDPKSRNPLEPGRKPFHTLNPALARFRDGRVLTYGSMGGYGQPQFQAQVFTRLVRFGMEAGDAVAAPRFVFESTPGKPGSGEVFVENRFDPDLLADLRRAGHEVVELNEPYADDVGHAGVILMRPDGCVLGAADPRADGAAVAA